MSDKKAESLDITSIQYSEGPKRFVVLGAGPVDECDTFDEAQALTALRKGASIYTRMQEFQPCDPESCCHENFNCIVSMQRIMETVADGPSLDGRPYNYFAEIQVYCAHCKTPFHFVGLPFGLSPTEPRLSADGTEARLPIAPGRDLPDTGDTRTLRHDVF